MRFAESMRHLRRGWIALLAIATSMAVFACADGLSPLSLANTPSELSATVRRAGAVTLRWKAVTSSSQGAIRSYVVERRVDANGNFVEVARIEQLGLPELAWIDTDVQPETIYGYRVIAVTVLGDRSAPSIVAGAVTPPAPGISLMIDSRVTAAESLDPDGYQVTIMGPDTLRATVATSGTRRFSPLRLGTYTVALTGVIERCTVESPTRTVVVTDTTAVTLVPVRFNVTCRDPNRGDLTVSVTQSGAVLDQSISIDVLGQASDTTLPAAERVFTVQRVVTTGAPSVTFSNVRPGTYTVTARDIALNCTLSGTAARTSTVSKLGTAIIAYAIACRDTAPPPPVSKAPFVWRNKWNPRTSATNSVVVLETTLDLTAVAGQAVKGVQADIAYDPTVLRFESEDIAQLNQITLNAREPGLIKILAATTGTAKTGVVGLFKLNFTVIGATGAKTATATSTVKASSPTPFDTLVRVVEDTLSVGTAVGGAANVPPVARAGGPYTSTAGTPITLSGAGSTDADGTIASYAWAFGDNTTGTGVSPSKTYATAGTYTATLTVTDNQGATATSTATVTIAAASGGGGGGTPAPVANANGPYSATTGVPVTLSSAGSTNATSFSWSLGNGQTATGASPSVTYASSGAYTITLTATGATGLTATATTSITVVSPPPPSPTTLEWKNLFGPFDVANNTVSITILYDTRVNIPETPGAEALEKFSVDSLKWDPSVLQFVSINLGPNITGTSNQVGATAGRLGLQGTIGGAQQQGLITIATIRLRPVGTSNATTTTKTFLGALLGPSSTNFFSYNAKTTITEGQFTVP